jgi:lambda repressor-like predicted transcriptional regulator
MKHSPPDADMRDEHLQACQGFAATLPRYLGASTPVQAVVRDLVQLFNNAAVGADERERVVRALAVTLHESAGDRPREQTAPPLAHPSAAELEVCRRRLEREEELFVANLKRLMSERRLTQAELAERVGLSQPAISMMLARKYRPQRRTVRLLAQVLGVAEGELWPEDVPGEVGPPANGAGPAAAPPRAPSADPLP